MNLKVLSADSLQCIFEVDIPDGINIYPKNVVAIHKLYVGKFDD